MNELNVVSVGALAILGAILAVLVVQFLRVREIWQMLRACQGIVRCANRWETENKELRSALRAEKAHVEQLQGKVVILQGLVTTA